MPTGYTAKLCKGGQSFEDFVLKCALNFGACIMQRDDDLDERPKIHEETYYQDKLVEAFDKYAELKNKSEYICFEEEKAEIENTIKEYEKQIEETKKTKVRLENMLSLVKDWNAPTRNHIGLKDFMMEQINSTIDFDGSWSYYEEAIERSKERLKSLTPKSSKEALLESAEEDIERYKRESEKEVQRNNERRDWIQNLYKSLNIEI